MADRRTTRERRLLKSRSRATGRTVSEFIRATIGVYTWRRELTTVDRIRLARHAAGAWKDFPETGAEYVERIRGSRAIVADDGTVVKRLVFDTSVLIDRCARRVRRVPQAAVCTSRRSRVWCAFKARLASRSR